MSQSHPSLDHLTIVLVRPRIPENIGAAARVCYNMGINSLVVIRDSIPPREPMAKMATHKAAHLIDQLPVYPDLGQALEDFTVVVGTTARRGKQRFVQQSPREMVNKLLPLLPKNRVAILFGPEDTGLTNEDLKYCHMTSAIPTSQFSSLNLAQAVAIHCYELYYNIVHIPKNLTPAPQLAGSFELESMYDHIEQSLLEIRFLDHKGRDHWMANIRNLLGRLRLTSKDANILRGICKKFLQHQQGPP
ncbi:RNA methyltransferase [Desulforhopalus singaporensis]|uniref:tRNA (cytidine/uridine-2'-O-)-methyltransferase TrmJ n=1 Tax=Desulforhopalus singaporensis TaxID=91360 RepID=A0A1H0NFW3_9BACT|nr:RNA methyltransferase [Desulforhopalus singaporensis]SDO91589.1 tRNA/rRNA methyltransferase [Desulforhopalus singaporensis]